MKFIAIIPSRYASNRFPGKALALIQGVPMIQRVFEQVALTDGIDQVYVATDDMRIAKVIEESGGNVIMTTEDHPSGTSRCNEAKDILMAGSYLDDNDIIINVQGDEPFIDPLQIQLVMNSFREEKVKICTLVKKIDNSEELFDENIVKVVVDQQQKALLFSRQAIPLIRSAKKEDWTGHYNYLKHIGLYAYRAETLTEVASFKQSKLDEVESLEQLTWLDHGYEIYTMLTTIDSIGVDVPEDLLKFDNEI